MSHTEAEGDSTEGHGTEGHQSVLRSLQQRVSEVEKTLTMTKTASQNQRRKNNIIGTG